MKEVYIIEYDNGLDYADANTYIGEIFFETYDEAKQFLLEDFECQELNGEEYFTEKYNGQLYPESALIIKLKKH